MKRLHVFVLAAAALGLAVEAVISPATSVAAALAIVLLASVLLWHHRFVGAARKPGSPGRLSRYPSISVIRPVRGADVGAEDNFLAALDTGYPGDVETLFVFDTEDDPGLPIARRVVDQHRRAGRPGTADVLVAGAPPRGRTGKLNAMIVGSARAHGELVAFGDSDTRPDRDVLRVLVETLIGTPGAGSASAPVVVHQPPRHGGDVMYGLMQNSLYAPLAAYAAGAKRELPFIMGQLMVFTREALDAIGGVGCAEGQLVDDMYIGRCVHQAGYKNVLSTQPLHIETGGMTTRQFLPTYRRWLQFSRNGLPVSFTWRQWMSGAEFFASLAGSLIALGTGNVALALLFALPLLAQSWSITVLYRLFGGASIPPRLWWAVPSFYLLSPLVVASMYILPRVDWRGRVYDLKEDAALAA